VSSGELLTKGKNYGISSWGAVSGQESSDFMTSQDRVIDVERVEATRDSDPPAEGFCPAAPGNQIGIQEILDSAKTPPDPTASRRSSKRKRRTDA